MSQNHSTNKKFLLIKVAVGGAVVLGLGVGRLLWRARPKKITVVKSVDWDTFQGVWYEIVRTPVKIERRTFTNNTFEFKNVSEDGFDLEIHYKTKEGYLGQFYSEAKFLNQPAKSKFEVRYLPGIFGRFKTTKLGILYLDENEQFAIVGNMASRYFWLLSRAPHVNPLFVENHLEIVREMGFSLKDLIYVQHDAT